LYSSKIDNTEYLIITLALKLTLTKTKELL